MGACLFGLEAELALSAGMGGRSVPVRHAVIALAQLAGRKLVHLRGDGSRMFLANGSLIYVDCGYHPEVATPECTTPWEAVSHLRAAERMVADLAKPLREELGVDEILVSRGNVDYLSGTTWGCHESYLSRLPITKYQDWLIPHLASRTIFTGSGGLDPLSPGIRFSLSPRVAHIVHVVSSESTSRRGIFHTRDESLSKGYNRLHVLAGDNACSQLSTLLKVGTTALVVALAEIRGKPLLKLKQPVEAMKSFARDLGFRAQVEMGRETCLMSAFDIQHRYLEAIEEHANTLRLPTWASSICMAWRNALDELCGEAGRGSHAFDWPLKRELFGRELNRNGYTWESVDSWSGALEGLAARWPESDDRTVAIDQKQIERLCTEHSKYRDIVDEASRTLAASGLAWRELDAFTALRQRLCAIDVRFGQVGDGIFDTLDRQGAIPDHRVVTENDITLAADNAPPETRASVRANWVKRLFPSRDRYICSWQGISGESVFLDLSDPFATDGQWQKIEAA